jgi:hypothetical protein
VWGRELERLRLRSVDVDVNGEIQFEFDIDIDIDIDKGFPERIHLLPEAARRDPSVRRVRRRDSTLW